MKHLHFASTILIALSLHATAGFSKELPELLLNDPNNAPYTTQHQDGFLDIIAGEAFKRVGYKLRLEKFPNERALLNANNGTTDGDLNRVSGLEKLYPNLIQVPEKIRDTHFCAWSKNQGIKGTPEEIRRHTVGYVRGWKIFEQMMSGAANIVITEDPEQLLRLLSLGRIEIALYVCEETAKIADDLHNHQLYVLEPRFPAIPLYTYLHKKHAALVPKYSAALRALKAEGFYDKIYRDKVTQQIKP